MGDTLKETFLQEHRLLVDKQILTDRSPLLLGLCSQLHWTSVYRSGLKASPSHLFTSTNHDFLFHLKHRSTASSALFCCSPRLKCLLGFGNIWDWKHGHQTEPSWDQPRGRALPTAASKPGEKGRPGACWKMVPCSAFSYNFAFSSSPRSSPSPHLHFALLALCFLFCIGATLSMTDPSCGLRALPRQHRITFLIIPSTSKKPSREVLALHLLSHFPLCYLRYPVPNGAPGKRLTRMQG